jgi:pilus assembly protein Flp/PilA
MYPSIQRVVSFLSSEDGPTSVEYGVMLALIVAVCVGAITTVGKNANTMFTSLSTTMSASS